MEPAPLSMAMKLWQSIERSWVVAATACCWITNWDMKLVGPWQVTPLLHDDVVESVVQTRLGNSGNVPQDGPAQVIVKEEGFPKPQSV